MEKIDMIWGIIKTILWQLGADFKSCNQCKRKLCIWQPMWMKTVSKSCLAAFIFSAEWSWCKSGHEILILWNLKLHYFSWFLTTKWIKRKPKSQKWILWLSWIIIRFTIEIATKLDPTKNFDVKRSVIAWKRNTSASCQTNYSGHFFAWLCVS
jgi:hypothetical protein